MSRKKQINQKITALYCRISLDDGGDNESMSISNQKIMLRDFAEKNGMFQYEYYVDDGYTGRNFNRPAFQRMIADIEAGKIGCVITKDLSRLGRNYIEARDLYNLVLKDIQELAAMALKDADAFYQRLSSRMERRYMADASEMQKERERLEARNREIDDMFLSLYTDKAKGVISEQRFMKLTAAMEQEQEENQRRLQEMMRMLQQSDAQESEVRTFIREIRQYATIQELDETVLNRLISRILVGEVKKVDGQKVQEVRIVYNFVGEIV